MDSPERSGVRADQSERNTVNLSLLIVPGAQQGDIDPVDLCNLTVDGVDAESSPVFRIPDADPGMIRSEVEASRQGGNGAGTPERDCNRQVKQQGWENRACMQRNTIRPAKCSFSDR